MSKITIQDKICAAGCLAALLMAGLMGCETGPLAKAKWSNPFAQPDTSYKESYGLTPAQIAQNIRHLGDNAATMTPTEQQLACDGLFERYSKEPDPLIRREMVYALGLFPDGYSLPALRAALNDADPFVRVEACRAWSRKSSSNASAPEALNALASAAQTDDNIDVRQAAVKGLRGFQSPKAIHVLGSMLKERDPALQYLAIQSLKGATGMDLGDDVRKWNEYIASNFGGSPGAMPPPPGGNQNGSMFAETPSTDAWR